MSSPNVYSSGIGGTAGADLVTLSPLLTSGDIWYVSNSIGSDAAAPRGKERVRPLATLAQAYTNAAANDVIVLLSGHTETLSAGQTLAKAGLLILGEGQGANRPKFTRNVNAVLWDITAAGVYIENVYFPASTLASATAQVRTAASGTQIVNCYLEHGANDTGAAIETVTGAGNVRVTDSTVISVATLLTAQPESAIKVTNALSDLWLSNLVIDGGTTGWSNPYAINGAAAITRLWAKNIDLLGDSDAILATGSSGYFHVRNKGGSARVVWTA